MPLLSLPNEILFEIGTYTAYYNWPHKSWILCDLSSFSRVHSHFHALLTPILHKLVHRQYLLTWAVENDDHYAITLALSLGADINRRCTLELIDHAAPVVEDNDAPDVEVNDAPDVEDNDGYRTPTNIATQRCCRFPHSHEMYDTLVLVLESGGKPTSQCLASAVFADDLGLIELLVEHGADVNKFYLGRSPLMAAAYDERTHVMRLLLEMGASVEDESHYLSVYHRSHTETSIEVLRILLEGGTIGTRLQVGGCMAEVVWYNWLL